MDNTARGNREILFDHFHSLLDLIPDGVYISDRRGKTLLVNSAYERLTGIPASQFIGHNVIELKEKGIFSTVVNPLVVATGETATSVQEVNGRKVILIGNPIFDRREQVELVVTFVRDITAFDRLNQEISAQRALLDYYQRQAAGLDPEEVFHTTGMIAVSSTSLKLLKAIDVLAPTDAPVLILGETGVGKDVAARIIHQKSRRASEPFLKVDCSAIPETLVESELFGYRAGAFSGAHAKGKAGYFEKANRGTLFLDEIGELSLNMQTKLLRAIEDQEIVRLGSAEVTPVDVRIIAATNRDLESAVSKGSFRADLFYRIKVAVIKIMPLKERKDDILPMARVFLKRFNQKYKKNLTFTGKAETRLLNYDWPGNIREMENMIHGLVITSDKPRINSRDLPLGRSSRSDSVGSGSLLQTYSLGGGSLKDIVGVMEKDLIAETVAVYGSIGKAAEVLRVDRSTIFRKMRSAHAPPDKKGKKNR